MHALDIIFWAFFAFVVAFIAWSFIRLLIEMLRDLWRPPDVRRPVRGGRASSLGGAAGGVHAGGELSTTIGGTDHSSSSTHGDLGSGESESGGDSGGSDFSGGGGDSGGGGSSGGW